MARILGISAHFHDSAAALVEDGKVIAAAQEERFTRVKGDHGFPHAAVAYCLDEAEIGETELDHIVFYENPRAKFERLLTNYHVTAPFGWRSYLAAMGGWLTQKLWLERQIARDMGVDPKVILSCDHHLSHAASAFFPSPFEESAILTIDGVGEWSTATIAKGRGNRVEFLHQLRYPSSVGLLYSAFTYYTGFRINSGEYKLMGLAPYGEPRFADRIKRELLHINDDGSLVMNQRFFGYTTGLRMVNRRFADLFGRRPRKPESDLEPFHMDVAASIQAVVEEVVVKMARFAREETDCTHLVMAGGVALNCVANGLLQRAGIFDDIWVQPAAGDAGGALGAALWCWHHHLGEPREPQQPDAMEGAFLGPDIAPSSESDDRILERMGATWTTHEVEELVDEVAKGIAAGNVIGIARGRMEFGPRALGNRSILGDATSAEMQSRMNLKIKFRESFRPFAPIVLDEDKADYFDTEFSSPYMLFVSDVREDRRKTYEDEDVKGLARLKVPHSDIPAVTHVNYSARLQTVHDEHAFVQPVLRRLKELTGCPVVINTSFNVRGEPIVCTVEDAYRCFMATEMDAVVIGNRLLRKEDQSARAVTVEEREAWLKRFPLD